MKEYIALAAKAANPIGRTAAIAYLNKVLPSMWASRYPATGGDLLTVTLGGRLGENGAVTTMFDLQPVNSGSDSRAVAVWGLSRRESAGTRETDRMAGFLRGVWSTTYPGRDRGHLFAHTMGGGTDINLFPQLASVNRGGEWRRMERFAADNPGTFCFIRPIYKGTGWTPTGLEYGIFMLPPTNPFKFWGNLFPN